MALIGATLIPIGREVDLELKGFVCLACGDRGTADAFLNLLIFTPGGYLLARLAGLRSGVLALASLSIAVEFMQASIPGRDPSLSDVVFNTLGTCLGASLSLPWGLRVARGAGIPLAGVSWLAPLVLMLPTASPVRLFGQWAPRFENVEVFSGQVLRAEVGSLAIPSWEVTSSRLRGSLDGWDDISVSVSWAHPSTGLVAAFAIADGGGTQIRLLGFSGQDLAFRYRAVASNLRLEQPAFWLREGARGLGPGDTASIRVERQGRSTCLGSEGRTSCRVGVGSERAWQFLAGSNIPPGSIKASCLTALWCLVLGGLIGFGLPGWRSAGLGALSLVGTSALAAEFSPYMGFSLTWSLLMVIGSGIAGHFGAGTKRQSK